MRRIFLLVSIIVLSINFSVAQTSSEEEKIKVLITESFDKIFSAKELSAVSDYYTDDFLLLEQGEVWNMAKIHRTLQMMKNDTAKRINSFDFIKVEVTGNSAWVAYHNTAKIIRNGKEIYVYWLESATAVKTKDGWRLNMLHSTRKQQKEEMRE